MRRVASIGIVSLLGVAAALAQTIPPPATQPAPIVPPDPELDQPLLEPARPAPGAAAPTTEPVAPPAGETAQDRPPMTLADVLAVVQRLIAEGRYEQAEAVLSDVLRRDPDNFDARLLMGQLYMARQDIMSARTIYTELLKVQPNNFDVNLGLGRIFVALQYWRQVPRYLDAADRVARPDQKVEVKILLAIAHRGAGNLRLALQAAQEAVAADVTSYDARFTLMSVQSALEEFEPAAAEARTLVEIATRQVEAARGDPAPLRRLAAAYEALIGVLRELFRTQHQRDAAGAYVEALLAGREQVAAAILQQIVDVMLRVAEIRRVLAHHDALLLAARSSELDPTNPDVLTREALLLLNTEQTEAAVRLFQHIHQLDPSNATAIRELQRLNAPLTSQPAASQPAAAVMP